MKLLRVVERTPCLRENTVKLNTDAQNAALDLHVGYVTGRVYPFLPPQTKCQNIVELSSNRQHGYNYSLAFQLNNLSFT